MNAHSQDRRDFIKFALAASSLSFAPCPRWAFGSEERTTWYRNAKFGMFIHWGPYSLASVEASWPIMRPAAGGITEAEYRELPKRFNPTKFDPHAFVDLARAAGQQYMVFTTKHHDGFCMFDTSFTDYKITNTPYGQDIVKQLANACKERGMPLGFYYSPPDMHHPAFRDTSKLAKENWNGEPARPEWPLYLDYMQLQLAELLTGYGPLVEVWFDGANGEGPNGKRQEYDWPRIHRVVRTLQPRALMFSDAGPDIRWIGNERGVADDPNWCTVDPARVPYPGASGPEVTAALQDGDPAGSVWRPGEADVSIRPGWFWHEKENDRVKTPRQLFDLYFLSVGRGASLLLNIPPDRRGRLHENDVSSLREFGNLLQQTFALNLARGAKVRASNVRGGDKQFAGGKFWTMTGAVIGRPMTG